MYGGIQELMRNRDYYYRSTVNIEYSHWTEPGIQALTEYMNTMGWMMLKAEEKELDSRAKNMVLNTLKGEQQTP